jgi:predicted CoA-binding protein
LKCSGLTNHQDPLQLTHIMNEPDTIKNILKLKIIAVVGMSPKPERPSHYVSMYMKEHGYTIIPVNPGQTEIAGETCYPSLLEIPYKIDVVDVFRRPEHVLPIAELAVKISAKALWLQDDVINEEAAEIAERAGLLVVMNDCMLRQHRQIKN